MYLMFMTKFDTPIPTFDSLYPYLVGCDITLKILVIFSIIWIIFFLGLHLYSLYQNLSKFFKFKKTEEFQKLKNSNEEVTLMSIPLTLAMTMNALFIWAAIFIPKLWTVIEYIFPLAIVGFVAIWIYALKLYWEYFTRLMVKWNFDFDKNNSLSQMISVFAFSMVWVWLAWPTAMSHNLMTSATSMFFSLFFLTVAFLLLVIKLILWFKSMFRKWISIEASTSLWIMIPILTLFGISLVRHKFALAHWFDVELNKISMFILTSVIISIQLLFWYLWYFVMKSKSYFKDYINWDKKSVGSYALICPWVASFVFWMFFIHKGLVFSGIIEQFSLIYFILLLPLIYIQYKTIATLYKLDKKLS
jgi:hypothetical protein